MQDASGGPRWTPCSPPPAGAAAGPPLHIRRDSLTARSRCCASSHAGSANKQVASALGISAKTVGRHLEHIYAKAGVTTRAGATLFAMEQGLLY